LITDLTVLHYAVWILQSDSSSRAVSAGSKHRSKLPVIDLEVSSVTIPCKSLIQLTPSQCFLSAYLNALLLMFSISSPVWLYQYSGIYIFCLPIHDVSFTLFEFKYPKYTEW